MKRNQWFSWLLSASLLLGLLAVGYVPATAADNLAANGDLEFGNTTGWEIASATVDSGVTYAGNYSLKLTATAAYSGAAYKIVPVGKGATVTVSFYYRYASNPGSGCEYHVYTYKGENANVGAYSNADAALTIPSGCDPITTWKQISYTFNSGDYAKIYLKFCPGGSGSSTCYIDNLVVTATGGTQEQVAPYLTSFGTKYNRPSKTENNLIKNGDFESTTGAQWNCNTFIQKDVSVIEDASAPAGSKSLCFDAGQTTKAAWYTFPVSVEKYTQYTFSAWVKSPRLSATNHATATFGVADASTGKFLVYEPYNGNGYGSASLSTPTMQLMATAPDGEWHLRSVTFYSGTADTVNVALYGAQSRLQLDGIALYKSAYGVEYISELRIATITAKTNSGNKYCANDLSLIPGPHMTGEVAEQHWSANPAWRNGFLSFVNTDDDHVTALQYDASDNPLQLAYIDWIDVLPDTEYTFTMDMKRMKAGNGRIALLDDNIMNPAEFYSQSFSQKDSDWKTYSVTFNSGVYSRVGLMIVDGGGTALIDKTRLFPTAVGTANEPADEAIPSLKPTSEMTSVMEMSSYQPEITIVNADFEKGSLAGWDPYQSTVISTEAAHDGAYGAHLKGDGSWGAMIEQLNIPVRDGGTYDFSYWYRAITSGSNITIKGATTGITYANTWASNTQWTQVTTTFTVVGDTALIFNACGGGNGIAESLYLDSIVLSDPTAGPDLGIAFLMELPSQGATFSQQYVGDLTNAKVDAYGTGEMYRLVQMGAVVTNSSLVGKSRLAFTREGVDADRRVVDVPAKYLTQILDDRATFSVRVINVPYRCANVVVYARPYYVFEKDGEEIVVYGDIYSRSYNNRGEDVFLD